MSFVNFHLNKILILQKSHNPKKKKNWPLFETIFQTIAHLRKN